MDPATITMLAKAAVAALSDEKLRKTIGWVIAAILSPIILIVVLICSLLSGTANHNNTAVDLTFNGAESLCGGVISGKVPDEYRAYITEMRDCFTALDGAISEVEGMMEDGDSLDEIRGKVTSEFGYRPNPFSGAGGEGHTGLDMGAGKGTPIRAVQAERCCSSAINHQLRISPRHRPRRRVGYTLRSLLGNSRDRGADRQHRGCHCQSRQHRAKHRKPSAFGVYSGWHTAESEKLFTITDAPQ